MASKQLSVESKSRSLGARVLLLAALDAEPSELLGKPGRTTHEDPHSAARVFPADLRQRHRPVRSPKQTWRRLISCREGIKAVDIMPD